MKVLVVCLIVASGGTGYYYGFERTLMLSEIVGSSDDPTVELAVTLFDFDTGLTRYDLYHLSRRAPEWSSRMEEIDAMEDWEERQRQQHLLTAEMMRDPSMKKVMKKLFGISTSAAKAVLSAVSSFKSFGLF